MENTEWFNEKNNEEKEVLKKISNEALEKVGKTEDSSSVKALDEEDVQYIRNVFPKTNEDTLQDDYAKKILMEGGEVFDARLRSFNEAEETKKVISQKETQLQLLLEEKSKAVDALRMLDLKVRTLSEYVNTEEGKANSSIYIKTQQQLVVDKARLKEMVKAITNRDGASTDEALEQLMKEYNEIEDTYYKMKQTWPSSSPDNPEAN